MSATFASGAFGRAKTAAPGPAEPSLKPKGGVAGESGLGRRRDSRSPVPSAWDGLRGGLWSSFIRVKPAGGGYFCHRHAYPGGAFIFSGLGGWRGLGGFTLGGRIFCSLGGLSGTAIMFHGMAAPPD